MNWRRKPVGVKAGFERRAFPRFPARFVAYMVSIDEKQLQEPVRACIEDISAGGVALSTSDPIMPGTLLRVSFAFPGEVRPSDVNVEVVGLTRSVTRQYVAHCRFVALPDAIRDKIAGRDGPAHPATVEDAP